MSRCPEKHDLKDETIKCKTCKGRGETRWRGKKCQDCHGKRRIVCPQCQVCQKCEGSGSGWFFNCGECNGTGRVLIEHKSAQQVQKIAAKPKPAPPAPQKSLNEVGVDYYKASNFTKAHEFFQKAANKGDAKGSYNLGLLYYQGEGCDPNIYTAEKWFKKAESQGHSEARKRLSEIRQQQRQWEQERRAQELADIEAKERREEARQTAIYQMQDEDRSRYG